MLFNALLLNALASVVVASPASIHRRQDLETFIENERSVAQQGILNNIGPDGKLVKGAAAGIVVASPSKVDPNYFYTWTRDAALTMLDLIHDFINGDSPLEPLIQQYITAQAKLQPVANPAGNLTTGASLGEAKFEVNGTAFTGPWGRPQRDTGFDLWEEVNATSFFTTAAQHKSLVQGDAFATALGESCDSCTVAPEILCHLQDYWNGTAIVSNTPTGGRSGLDINSVLTSLQIFDPAAACDDVTFQPCSSRALSNHKVLVDSFRSIYGVNNGTSSGAVAVGRYPEDVYKGGNPWYLSILASAEQLYDALYQWTQQGSLNVTSTSLPFFKDLVSNVTVGVYPASSPAYITLTKAVKKYADGFIAVVQKYTPTDGSLAEEFDRNTGAPASAVHLTWSYASFVTAASRRDGSVPPSWGASAAKSIPGQCSAETVTGTYPTPSTPWW
ncbi:hypothetical protein ASPWEDRAFT_52801 [Aspergillus wentii DTO 134E9]|uniref:glucan 1,4-alpha-glucosidase n=1 Tax=Aspergillus wentii DTO 134E9 TaxID=1073089 RepID=A0A1L9RCK9_ASPWE|nr:uncharacterized protein ASPWEDRAFT_52801 [Aspergillus wentii DTO 134E9]OJJ32607.1 hypothetical protein ASPWEDRAFT_52801 [Aspergillus wentii DTO 134E9]